MGRTGEDRVQAAELRRLTDGLESEVMLRAFSVRRSLCGSTPSYPASVSGHVLAQRFCMRAARLLFACYLCLMSKISRSKEQSEAIGITVRSAL